MILLCRHFRKSRPNPDYTISNIRSQIFPAISYIDSHYPQEISVKQLANLCNMTQNQLTGSFQKAFEKTPLQYLRQVRIQKACTLLDRTEDSILSIAYASGFSSVSSFNRCFQELLQKTPLFEMSDGQFERNSCFMHLTAIFLHFLLPYRIPNLMKSILQLMITHTIYSQLAQVYEVDWLQFNLPL